MTNNKKYHVYLDSETYKTIYDLKFALGLKTLGEAVKIMKDYYIVGNENE